MFLKRRKNWALEKSSELMQYKASALLWWYTVPHQTSKVPPTPTHNTSTNQKTPNKKPQRKLPHPVKRKKKITPDTKLPRSSRRDHKAYDKDIATIAGITQLPIQYILVHYFPKLPISGSRWLVCFVLGLTYVLVCTGICDRIWLVG